MTQLPADRPSPASYWRNRFATPPAELELPADRRRPAASARQTARLAAAFDPASRSSLREAAGRLGQPFSLYLFTGFAALLSRLGATEDLVVGVPGATLNALTDSRQPLPCPADLVPMLVNFSGEQTFAQSAEQLAATIADALRHPAPKFDELLALLAIPASPVRTPLVSAGFALSPATVFPPLDLALVIAESETELTLTCQYDPELFDDTTIQRWLGHYRTLLCSAASDAHKPVARLPLLNPAEEQLILRDWNATAVAYPQDVCVHQLIEAQAARTPDAVAVVFKDRHFTYRELDERANQLAHLLQSRGVCADRFVGVCMERSFELVVALVGVMKAGGAYVPIDPADPRDRIAYALNDSGVTLLLTQQHLLPRLPSHQAETVAIDNFQALAGQPATKAPELAAAGSLAYSIYTSGSTGQPKSAMNPHRGVVNRLLWMQDAYGISANDVVMQKTPFSFDVSVWEFFQPLIVGAKLVVAIPDGHQDPAYLSRLIRERNVTIIHFVPSMLRVFLDEPDVEKCTSVRMVVCSGEALPFDVQEAFYRRHPARLENLYGPTETAVEITRWSCPRDGSRKIVPIGRPIANSQTYIVDPLLQPVPIGVPGELLLGGVQVGRGYHNRPELTQEKFIRDPFVGVPGARLYRTGDLARYLPDGNIEYLGRIDHQVKLRGLRIELGEIESVLALCPLVRESVVVAHEQPSREKVLVAYLVPAAATADAAAVRAHLKAHLPEYMVPALFVFLPQLPHTSNGKINRRALPPPDFNRTSGSVPRQAPRNDTERELAAIWRDVLGIEVPGIDDNFFELGGHSLLALKVVSRVRQQLGVEMPATLVFERPTIADQAAWIGRQHIEQASPEELSRLLAEIESGSNRRPA